MNNALLAARMRVWSFVCLSSLPLLLLIGAIQGMVGHRSFHGRGLFEPALCCRISQLGWVGAGALAWVVLLGAYLLAITVSACAAVRGRSALSAIASADGVLLLIHAMALCLGGWPLLPLYLAAPWFLNDAAAQWESMGEGGAK